MDQRLRQNEALLHAAREAVDKRFALRREIDEFEHVRNQRAPACAWKTVGGREEIEELPHLHAVVKSERVGHETDRALDVVDLPQYVEAIDARAAAGRF